MNMFFDENHVAENAIIEALIYFLDEYQNKKVSMQKLINALGSAHEDLSFLLRLRDEDSKRLKKVKRVSLNGDCIQLTVEKWEKGE